MRRVCAGFLTLVLLLTLLPANGWAKEKKEDSGPKLAKESASAILMVADTGTVLYKKNADKELPPASMTKIMTMLLIMEALDSGKISLDEKVRASEHAASMGGSQIFLEEGETMTVKQLLKAVAIGSANDASVALAEYIAGSEEAFVKMMNRKAKELGLEHTHFSNATGLPAKNHYSSAEDMAVMARALLQHEKITEYTGTYEEYLREGTDNKFWLVNTNRLVKFYPGVDGLKTGYTNEAKYCLTATAERHEMRVIAVVMGASTPKDRNRQVTKMLDYAFNQYRTHKIYDEGTVIGKVHVDKGVNNRMPVITSRKVAVLTKKGESPKHIKKTIDLEENLKAPVKKGEQVGKVIVKKEGEIVTEVPLVAGEKVPEASWWQLFKRSLGNLTLQSNDH
ncbi:MAG TPA: D-alanyl-D-alanine carboxypeptidase family protein [Bacillales bacterium]|nr:D-alanyl-D-alanine carboxypeptidase family protein [Bacillales bacterium]